MLKTKLILNYRVNFIKLTLCQENPVAATTTHHYELSESECDLKRRYLLRLLIKLAVLEFYSPVSAPQLLVD